MNKLSLRDLPLKGKRVLMRVDYNVPLNSNGTIADSSRIEASLPSIRYILDHGGSLVLMSHLGRPEGKKNQKYTLAPCAKKLSELLHRPVNFSPDCIGAEVEKLVSLQKPGSLLLLENLRFYPAEEHPEIDPSFASSLAKLGDFYVNDAFGTAHRAHSSTSLIASFFPHRSAAGLLMEKEINLLGSLLTHPKRPFFALIGGSKVSTKAGAILHLLPRLDALFIGGGMAYTFLKTQGIPIGQSLFDPAEEAVAKKILEKAANQSLSCYLPIDLVVAKSFDNNSQSQIISTSTGVPEGWQGMGIGPKTIAAWTEALSPAQTIFWNGPLSVFELPNFASGTYEIAKMLSQSKATVVVGGGDSVAAITQMGLQNSFAHLSTGGGASLEFLEFGHLPGIDSLSNLK